MLSITADSLGYDFGRLAPLEFVFIDGGHDLAHAFNGSRKAYNSLAPGGWLVWHDFGSPVPWVEVRPAIEAVGSAKPVVHAAGTEVAFLRKCAAWLGLRRTRRCPRAQATASLWRRPPAGTSGHSHRGGWGGGDWEGGGWEGDFEALHRCPLVKRAICPGRRSPSGGMSRPAASAVRSATATSRGSATDEHGCTRMGRRQAGAAAMREPESWLATGRRSLLPVPLPSVCIRVHPWLKSPRLEGQDEPDHDRADEQDNLPTCLASVAFRTDRFDHASCSRCSPAATRCSATSHRASACAEGLSFDPDDAELLFRKAVLHRRQASPPRPSRAGVGS